MADARKPLPVLQEEWRSCTACALGQRRVMLGNPFVAGEGAPGGIVFVGEGPGRIEEQWGRPFVGPSGTFLRDALAKLNFRHYYLTNLVTCRSCEMKSDPVTGLPRMVERRGRPPEPLYMDSVPLPPQIAACRPRLEEELYLLDPVLIVTLGGTAAEAVLGHPVTITRDHGQTEHIEIPGATYRPVLTDKKQVWGRKLNGELTTPVIANPVRYLVLPMLHPAYVLRKLSDRGHDSAVRQFGADLRTAVKIYERYMMESYGTKATSTVDADLSNLGVLYDESAEGQEGPGD